MRTRGSNWERVPCALCGAPHQRLIHWAQCPKLRPLFDRLRWLDGGESWDDPRVNLHGIGTNSDVSIAADGETLRNSSQRKVEEGVNMVHMVTWKFILIALTKLSIEGTPLDAAAILEAAQRRIKRRLDSLKVGIHTKVVRARAREDEPNLDRERKWTRGIGEIDDEGKFTPSETLERWLA